MNLNLDITGNEPVESQKELALLLSISRDLASVRDKKDLIGIINSKFKETFIFDDFLICTVQEPQEFHRTFFHNTDLTKDGLKAFFLSGENLPIQDGFFEIAHSSKGITRFDIQKTLQENTASPAYLSEIHQKGIKEMIALPLVNQRGRIGVFFLLFKNPHTVNDESLRILEGLSYQLAITIANIVANEEIEERENEKSILLSVGNNIASARSRSDLQHIVSKQVLDLFSANFYTFCLLNEDGNTHTPFLHSHDGEIPQAGHGVNPVIQDLHKVNDGIFDLAMQAESPLIFPIKELLHLKEIPRYVNHWAKAGIRELMVIKILNANEPKGVLYLYAEKAGSFFKDKFSLLQGIAAQLGTGIFNVLANEKIEQQLVEINKFKQQLLAENHYLQQENKSANSFSEIIGSGPEIQKIFHLISQVAFSDSTVLLLGETGTGKELIARAIHKESPRKDKLMIKVNCAALPPNLIESELFGHEKGSFTGSVDRRIGKFELANKSTLFLDEIGELSLELQVKLLRVLQEREIERVGGRSTIKVDVRIIAATNRNLFIEVEAGRFRSDLFYRLNVFPITLPPLRDRKEDITTLTSHFITIYAKNAGKKITGMSQNVIREMMAYSWPGNVRELQHLVERSVLLADGPTIKEIHLPKNPPISTSVQEYDFVIKPLEQVEKEYILKVVKSCGGRISGQHGAAAKLGLPSTTLISRMQRLGIKKDHFIEKK
ncbi:sigma 54-interacting transcriptional regulator [Dyadobacter sp. 3J3]|uniref:sigma 54-interacting transcriptional regulator n=1 Tax=Dyadobacter sp. 3J3 TaxID=2606600 RepID=UPI001E3C82DA|nr:sigma 54-interacting transcriptional regulator [Dyadobacter sp. 3J3]